MKTMNINQVEFRCSKLGLIMTDPKDGKITELQLEKIDELVIKSRTKQLTPNQAAELDRLIAKRDTPPPLSDTCTKYLAELYVTLKYGRTKEITNRYMEKGLMVEEDAITLYSLVKGRPFFKNEETFRNGFIKGTPDENNPKDPDVKDVKSSWDIFTFMATTTAGLNKTYEWQLRGYMWLTGKPLGRLAYVLIDTPETLVNDIKRKLLWQMGVTTELDPLYLEACAELERVHTFGDIPNQERINEIEIPHSDKKQQELKARIIQCRNWMVQTWPDFFTSN